MPLHHRMAAAMRHQIRTVEKSSVAEAFLLLQSAAVQDFSDSALIVLGHGTELNENSAVPVRQHVAGLRRRQIFKEVHEAFWKQEPQIKTVLAGISARRIFIAPL